VKKNVFLEQVSGADSETLLLSSQVMLNELARRYLESRQNDMESEQTTHNKQSAPCSFCGSTSAIQFKICSDCRSGMDV
jgi:hypothetical protein